MTEVVAWLALGVAVVALLVACLRRRPQQTWTPGAFEQFCNERQRFVSLSDARGEIATPQRLHWVYESPGVVKSASAVKFHLTTEEPLSEPLQVRYGRSIGGPWSEPTTLDADLPESVLAGGKWREITMDRFLWTAQPK